MKDEIKLFLEFKNKEFLSYFNDNNWITSLAYLADIFKKLNIINLNTLTANVHFCLLCVHLPCAIGTETVSFLNNCRIVTARVIMT